MQVNIPLVCKRPNVSLCIATEFSMHDTLWHELVKTSSLRAGWHLTRAELRSDFAQRLLISDAFARDLDASIEEISRQLKTDTYTPRPLIRVNVPKGTLGIRPGSVMQLEDRVVLFSAVRLIAPIIDPHLPHFVYSYRLKDKIEKTSLFRENDALDIPFLKSKTIQSELDPFDPWYAAWPEFDEKSRNAFTEEGFRFLTVSDISAYFENIQLELLRDKLLQFLPNDQKLVNLIHKCFRTWSVQTDSGRTALRGIPQGNSISSFFGNMFLLDLDLAYDEFCKDTGSRYYRYMDDVRIFSTTEADARNAVFLLDESVRRLHLNVQSGKTKILDESKSEISEELLDPRLDRLNEIHSSISKSKSNGEFDQTFIDDILAKLKQVADEEPHFKTHTKISNARGPITGLSLRTFRRWITCHCAVKSPLYRDALLRQISLNSDHRLTRRLENYVRDFPTHKSVQNKLTVFTRSDLNIYEHQEAEILRSLRYASHVPDPIFKKCAEYLVNRDTDSYLRCQACYLVGRTPMTSLQISSAWKLWESDEDVEVKSALSFILSHEIDEANRVFVRRFLLHPNKQISQLGRFFRKMKNDSQTAKQQLDYIFGGGYPYQVVDQLPLLYCVSSSSVPEILARFYALSQACSRHLPYVQVRKLITHMRRRVRERHNFKSEIHPISKALLQKLSVKNK